MIQVTLCIIRIDTTEVIFSINNINEEEITKQEHAVKLEAIKQDMTAFIKRI